ncbi:MAG: bifunctional YncE family protein/alkaline phosphatase family protein [Deltaproteobacteria bacterium]|nr:bifunctional YncE family protein/alkaline phosphatase family protein [Deltaproteobacteria bacterium]
MKRYLVFITICLGIFAFTSCSSSDNDTPLLTENVAEESSETQVPGDDFEGQVLLPSRLMHISPAGYQIPVGTLPLGMALSPDDRYLAVTNNGYGDQFVSIIDTSSRDEVQRLPVDKSFYGITFSPDGKRLYVSSGQDASIIVFEYKGGKFEVSKEIGVVTKNEDYVFTAGMALSPDASRLYVCCNMENVLAVVDLSQNKVIQKVPVALPVPVIGQFAPQAYPLDVVVSKDGSKLYVSNWGGNVVTVIKPDLLAEKAIVVDRITVGGHPSDMVLSPDGKKLYVANANTDNISVISTITDNVIGTISLAPYPNAPLGSQPNALAISPDGNTLYVANANNNDVAVLDVSSARGKAVGLIPVGWYPTALALSRDGKTLYVANGQGSMSKPNPKFPGAGEKNEQYIAELLNGTISIIDVPDEEKLAEYTAQVERNNGFNEGTKRRVEGWTPGNPIPKDENDTSPIKHVILIIKENRTYDQVLGDMPQGNGDPELCLFDEEVAPNHHALAEEFVLLDNFYVPSEVSMDGHEWLLAGTASDMCEKVWPSTYSGRGAPLDLRASGGYNKAPRPESGYIWDAAAKKGITFRVYGEYSVFGLSLHKEVMKNADPFYPGWEGFYLGFAYDPDRAREFLREFRLFEKMGNLPQLMILLLPDDHNYGTQAGKRSPKAMTAGNDLALGMIVDGVSKSSHWKDTAIFVVEDDAQDGPDHIDCHRTPAFVISAYTKRSYIDHTMYTTMSMLRTMELILGLPPMTQFDANALPMFACFQENPDLTPYECRPNTYPLTETNPEDSYASKECASWIWDLPDRTPMRRHNEIVWKSIKGVDSEMPEPKYNILVSDNDDDDD